MVFVKVRETYDLKTVSGKMTVIAVHTPNPSIIKANFPGLLMQCKSYRPVSADVRIACASTLPLDPLGVGTTEGDVAPEDLFNPILYKACTNFGMSQIEARIARQYSPDVNGPSAAVNVDEVTNLEDEFPIYYGFLSDAHEWRHANPQSGLEMTGLKPLVYEMLYNVGDNSASGSDVDVTFGDPASDGSMHRTNVKAIRGNAKPLPFINCTAYSSGEAEVGWPSSVDSGIYPRNHELDVPWINCVVGAIIVPPSRLHELFYRMVVEWTIEFSQIRSIGEITNWVGLSRLGAMTHYQNYDYSEMKKVVTGTDDTILDTDKCMVSSNVDVKKVM